MVNIFEHYLHWFFTSGVPKLIKRAEGLKIILK